MEGSQAKSKSLRRGYGSQGAGSGTSSPVPDAAVRSSWRDDAPRLHEFIGKVHRVIADDHIRKKFQTEVESCIAAHGSCRIPLPPESIGRAYRSCEIAFAMAVLSDADGAFPPILPDSHPKRREGDAYGRWLSIVRSGGRESWVPSLRPLLERLDRELHGPKHPYVYITPERRTKPITKVRAHRLLTNKKVANPSQAIDRLARKGDLRVMPFGGQFIFDVLEFPRDSWRQIVTRDSWGALQQLYPNVV